MKPFLLIIKRKRWYDLLRDIEALRQLQDIHAGQLHKMKLECGKLRVRITSLEDKNRKLSKAVVNLEKKLKKE